MFANRIACRVGLLTFAVNLALGANLATADSVLLSAIPLDNAEDMGTSIGIDTTTKSQGRAAVRISTKWPTVVNVGEVTGLEIDETTLVYEARVRSERLRGTAYLEMWCAFPDGGRYFSRGQQSAVNGTSDWTTLRTVFLLKKGQRPQSVTLNLVVSGTGTVWIDDARLSHQPAH